MLLQICEPGTTPSPHEADDDIAVGIDLGTTHTVASIMMDGVPVILKWGNQSLIPSAVRLFENGDAVVGEDALNAHKGELVLSIKRNMTHSTAAEACFSVGNTTWSAVTITAQILTYVKHKIETALGRPIHQAVITVPAYFDDAARTATKQAAKIAGIHVLRLLNEPTAAAIAYGVDMHSQKAFAIYDLGGGTFDVSILKPSEGVLRVLSTAGETQLGGDDFDNALIQLIEHKNAIKLPATPQTQLWARGLKQQLSYNSSLSFEIPLNDRKICGQISVDEFDEAIKPLVDKTLAIVDRALGDAKLSKDQLGHVILVGGSTRVPAVIRAVEAHFSKLPLCHLNPDEVVAMGAGIQAGALTHGANTVLLDVIPMSLGLETMGEIVEKIIHRNTPIPTIQSQTFTTFADGQSALTLHVVQGEREMVKDCRSLARFTLRDIPPQPAGAAKVTVTFQVDADGLLTVTAQEQTTGTKQCVEVNPTFGLTEEDMRAHLEGAMQHAQSDIKMRLLEGARLESTRLILALEKALALDSHLLDEGSLKDLHTAISDLKASLETQDRDAITVLHENLEQKSHIFAEKRMLNALSSHS
jgi:molecular chaperone HscA